ncbi:Arc family DNA-binding protein [Devosia chinhatensis]|uniref:Arc family DNA-binding protein n=2 Tax=Devosia aurantiaca TaxID=2714858 RepID=A0A6M1SHE7_9HYPH|nr:Arc family DNA-binding protein [Devosia aurantiaca]
MARVPSRGTDQFVLRFPEGMRERIKEQADQKGRSMNAEILTRLEEYEALDLGNDTLPAYVARLQDEIDRLRSTGIRLPNGLFYRVDDAATRRQRSVHEEVIQALESAYPAPVINEMDEVGFEWWGRISDAPPEQREHVLEEANADLKARGWSHEFWLEPEDEHGTPTLVLGIRRFGPLKERP